VTNPKGVWITIKNKQMTSENGYSYGTTSLVVDFEKLENHFLSSHLDSISKFTIDSKTNSILPEGDTTKINYSLYKKDSLEIYIKRQNLTKVLVPLNLNYKLKFTKNQIIKYLTNQQSYFAGDTLRMEFSNVFFTKGIEDKRVLRSKFPKKKFIGYWYIGQKNKNYFIIINPDPNNTGEYIFQITNLNKQRIKLNGILTKGFLNRVTEFKTSL